MMFIHKCIGLDAVNSCNGHNIKIIVLTWCVGLV